MSTQEEKLEAVARAESAIDSFGVANGETITAMLDVVESTYEQATLAGRILAVRGADLLIRTILQYRAVGGRIVFVDPPPADRE